MHKCIYAKIWLDEEVGCGSIAEAVLRHLNDQGSFKKIALGDLWSRPPYRLQKLIKKTDNFCCLSKLITNGIQNPPYEVVLYIQDLFRHHSHI